MDNEFEKIVVPIEDIVLLHAYVKRGYDTIRKEFDSIVDEYNKINEYWECQDWDDAYKLLVKNAQKMEDIVENLWDSASKLDTVIQVYTATENGNKSMITELPYNVLK